MGLFSFKKDAGESVMTSASDMNQQKDQILAHLKKYDLIPENMTASINGSKLNINGVVESLAEKNKILATAGNIKGISEVEDNISVRNGNGPVARAGFNELNQNAEKIAVEIDKSNEFYTVKKGDYLSKIAQEVYGNGNKYPVIFEANKPMLKDPDKIYPGQVLVIPELT